MRVAHLPLPAFLLLGLAPFAATGCGDGGEDGSSPAAVAPSDSPVFIETSTRRQGKLQANAEEIAQAVTGIDDLGGKIAAELESEDGKELDYEAEVEPWLGEKAGVFLGDFNGDEFGRVGVAIQTTDVDAAQSFVDEWAEADRDSVDDATYEGVEYKIDSADEKVYGMVGDLLVVTKEERAFKDAVDAANGDSLDEEAAFGEAMDAATEGSFADVYVDLGLLIEQSGNAISEQALQVLRGAGIDLSEQALQVLRTAAIGTREATAVASIVPGTDEIEIEISSDFGDQEVPSGDASELLESLPANSSAAFAVSGFDGQPQEALDRVDAEGLPGLTPPDQLKKGVKELGIDLEALAGSLQDAAVFATGASERGPTGAVVLTTEGSEASKAVKRAVTLIRGFNVGGITVLGGETSGFAVHRSGLGFNPLVVAARDDRMAIGSSVPAALLGLAAPAGKTLADNAAYEEAVASLEGTPISGFADRRGVLRLADALEPIVEDGPRKARPFLRRIAFIAVGTGTEGDRTTAKLIVGLEK